MLRLKSIRIDKLRKVQPGTVLNFTGDTNLVLGKNGVGKTTLLDVIACAAKLEFSAFENEEIDVTVKLCADENSEKSGLTIEARVRHSRIRKGPSFVDVVKKTPSPITAAMDVFVILGSSVFTIEIANGKVVASENTVQFLEFDGNALPGNIVKSLGEIWEFLHDSKRFDEASVFWRTYNQLKSRIAHGRLDESLDVVRAAMAMVGDFWQGATIFSTSENLSSPEDLRRALVAGVEGDRDIEQISATSRDVEFLRDFAQLVDAELVKTIFNRHSVDDFGESRTLTFHNQNFSIQRGKSVTYFEQFSYGQKRLLAILQYLATNIKVVVADEITNGLHHEWIEFIVKKLEGRQCFLTSQNPVLLDFLKFTSAAETQNRLIRCEHGANGMLIWRNLTDEEANDFYTSYETGMQHVGEIMLKQGLW